MLQNTLINVEKKLKEKTDIDQVKISKLINFLGKYKVNKIIYPGVITREVGISMTQTYQALGIFVEYKYLEKNYEVYCHNCGKFNGMKIYRSLAGIPEDKLCCDECDTDLNKLEDTVQVFRVTRVIKDGEQ